MALPGMRATALPVCMKALEEKATMQVPEAAWGKALLALPKEFDSKEVAGISGAKARRACLERVMLESPAMLLGVEVAEVA